MQVWSIIQFWTVPSLTERVDQIDSKTINKQKPETCVVKNPKPSKSSKQVKPSVSRVSMGVGKPIRLKKSTAALINLTKFLVWLNREHTFKSEDLHPLNDIPHDTPCTYKKNLFVSTR